MLLKKYKMEKEKDYELIECPICLNECFKGYAQGFSSLNGKPYPVGECEVCEKTNDIMNDITNDISLGIIRNALENMFYSEWKEKNGD